jgi:hypothetical protein
MKILIFFAELRFFRNDIDARLTKACALYDNRRRPRACGSHRAGFRADAGVNIRRSRKRGANPNSYALIHAHIHADANPNADTHGYTDPDTDPQSDAIAIV